MAENKGTNRVIRTPQECERTCHMVACITARANHAIKIVCAPATAIPWYIIYRGVVLCHCEFSYRKYEEAEDTFGHLDTLTPSEVSLTLPRYFLVPRKGPKKTCPKKIIFFYRRSSLFLFSYFPSIGLLLRDAAQISARGRERRSAVHTSGRARLQLGGLSL